MKTREPRRVDVAEVIEVFVDELRYLHYDGHVLRMEFDVTRKDGQAPEDDSRNWVYTASRIVMSAHGVPALLDQMARLQAALGPQAAAEPALQWKGREAGVGN